MVNKVGLNDSDEIIRKKEVFSESLHRKTFIYFSIELFDNSIGSINIVK